MGTESTQDYSQSQHGGGVNVIFLQNVMFRMVKIRILSIVNIKIQKIAQNNYHGVWKISRFDLEATPQYVAFILIPLRSCNYN